MSKVVEINFNWSQELALKASKLYYDYDMKNSNKRYIGWFFVALVQFGIVGALKHDSFGILYLSTFLVVYWYYGRWYLRKKMIVKYFANKNIDNIDVKFFVDKVGFKSKENIISWDDIIKVLQIDDDILVQTTADSLYFTKESFKSYDDLQKLISLAKEYKKL